MIIKMIINRSRLPPRVSANRITGYDSGEFQEKRLMHTDAEKFYRALAGTGQKVRVGVEASGELWMEMRAETWELNHST